MCADLIPDAARLAPFAPRLAAEWLQDAPAAEHRRLPGTMVFADISGFTRLTEALARRGRVGAELLSDTLDQTFATLLAPAFADGADLLKWGGDAVLLLFRGPGHAARAARAAHRMRAALRDLVRGQELPVAAALRMSIGIHSADDGPGTGFDFFFVGDPRSHRELLVGGPEASRLTLVEQQCGAGQILLSAATAALLSERVLGEPMPVGDTVARLLRTSPQPDPPAPAPAVRADSSMTLPPAIRAHLEAGGGEPDHRPIAVGFVQLSGLDALIAQHGVERAVAAVASAVIAVQRACLRHGVTFFESDIAADGAKIMLSAGAPRSAGHDAERMLRAALDIAEASGELGIRVGVNTGHVFTGELGPAVRRTTSIKGDAVNLAARLLGRARPGQVVATVQALAAVRARLDTDPIPPFLVKGKRAPVEASVVCAVGDAWGGAADELRFVGRSRELAVLRNAAEEASGGHGCVVDVVGEPGIGKSRLVAEFADGVGMPVIVTSVSGYDTGTSYAAVGMLLRTVLGIGPHEASAPAASRLVAAVGEHAPELRPWLPLLGVALDLSLPSTRRVEELDARFRRGRIEEVVLALLTALLVAPTLLVFEDAHVMDEASAALLHRLTAEAAVHPWCVVVTRRFLPVGFEPALGDPADRRVELAGMPPDDALDLLEQAAGSARPSRHALAAMADRARGNPLFLASLAANPGAAGEGGELPGSVEALLLVDIDRLPASDRTLLRLAAVLGARFEPGILSRLAPSPLDDDEIVARIGDFVRPAGEGAMEFRHAMVRDVAYAGLPFRQRHEMHARVARTLEELGDRAATADLLSLHFHEAGDHGRAWTFSLRAGAEARAKYAYAQAAAFFARALDSAAHLPQTPAADRSAASVSLGECLEMAGDSAGALTAFRKARRDLAGDLVATAEVLYKEARITVRLGRYRTGLSQLTRALHLLDEVPGTASETVRARLATRYGFCLHLQNRTAESVRWGRLGVQWAEASGDRGALADACNALHLSYGASELVEDRPFGRLALELYAQLDDLSGQAHVQNNLAVDAYNAGDWNRAIDAFAQAAASFHRIGDDANEANALYNRADVLVAQRRHAEALPVLTASLALARRVDDEELVGLVLREQARAESAAGSHERGRILFGQAREVLAGLGLATEVALLDAAHAEALAHDGDPDAALDLLARTIRDAEAKAADTLARLHRIRSQVLAAQGRRDEAAAAARAGLERTTGAYGGYEPALLRLALAEATRDRAMVAESRRVLQGLGVAG